MGWSACSRCPLLRRAHKPRSVTGTAASAAPTASRRLFNAGAMQTGELFERSVYPGSTIGTTAIAPPRMLPRVVHTVQGYPHDCGPQVSAAADHD